mgnify:CR=1 FL=1|jgi:hypothetical protein
MMGELIPMVLGVAFFSMIGFIFKVVVDGRRRREHLKIVTEFNSRLLDRLGSVSEFGQFLQTEGGARFLDTLSIEHDSAGPRERILRAVQTGVILTLLGLGFLTLGGLFSFDDHAFTVLGVIVLSLGVGFLLSSAASYRLARALGLLDAASAGRSNRG